MGWAGKIGEEESTDGTLLAGVGLGGILSTLAGAKEVRPCPEHPHISTNSLLGRHH